MCLSVGLFCIGQHRHRLEQAEEVVVYGEHALHEAFYARGVNAATLPLSAHATTEIGNPSPRDVNVTTSCLLYSAREREEMDDQADESVRDVCGEPRAA